MCSVDSFPCLQKQETSLLVNLDVQSLLFKYSIFNENFILKHYKHMLYVTLRGSKYILFHLIGLFGKTLFEKCLRWRLIFYTWQQKWVKLSQSYLFIENILALRKLWWSLIAKELLLLILFWKMFLNALV